MAWRSINLSRYISCHSSNWAWTSPRYVLQPRSHISSRHTASFPRLTASFSYIITSYNLVLIHHHVIQCRSHINTLITWSSLVLIYTPHWSLTSHDPAYIHFIITWSSLYTFHHHVIQPRSDIYTSLVIDITWSSLVLILKPNWSLTSRDLASLSYISMGPNWIRTNLKNNLDYAEKSVLVLANLTRKCFRITL